MRNLSCVYVTDRGFLPCTCFSIATLVAHTNDRPTIYLLHTGLSSEDVTEARSYLETVGAHVRMIAMPEGDLADFRRPASLPKATYGRLLMHRFLPDDLDRVVYIDGDTLVETDVAPLANVPLHGSVLGAVLDIGRILIGRREEAQQRLGLGPDGDYFNAGVLLIDWPKWKAEEIGERCIDALLKSPERFTQNDQCALNMVCSGSWTQLPARWNYQPANMLYGDVSAAIFHFLGGRKPWKTDHVRHSMRFVARYERLYAASPWAEEFRKPVFPYWAGDAVRIARNTLSPRYWSRGRRYLSLKIE